LSMHAPIFTRKIELLLNDKDRLEIMSVKYRNLALKYSWKNQATKYSNNLFSDSDVIKGLFNWKTKQS
jgi:hypothetical protein